MPTMPVKKRLANFGQNLLIGFLSGLLTLIAIAGLVLFVFFLTIPNVKQLRDVHLQVPLKIYTADNKLIAEYGEKKRTPVKLAEVPKLLIRAVLDTEDQRFYQHAGVDFIGLTRAIHNLYTTGKKSEGASTITMQVARDFFLSPEKTYTRKLREILIAFKIDHEFDKDTILELYLNKVYFGQRAYGVAAAAQIYFGKKLDELTLPEMATIAGLPQAPSRLNPLTNARSAIQRRNHVLKRMYESNDINKTTYLAAIHSPLNAYFHGLESEAPAPYVAEMARCEVINKFGPDVYDQGLKVYTTVDSRLQKLANHDLREGVLAYTKRHDLAVVEKNLGEYTEYWQKQLRAIPVFNGLYPAAITEVNNNSVTALLPNGETASFNISAKHQLKFGDVVRIQNQNGTWELSQLPKVNGALVSLNPKNGAILALVGGFSYAKNNFNIITQADRQPGSSLKPFIYSAALEKGFTLASVINDAPIVMSDYNGTDIWRPQNVTKQFYGPTRLRTALIESRNLVSIRLLQSIGIRYAIDYMLRFGFEAKDLPATPSLALGTANVSPLELTAAYATFANGGYHITPYLVSRIEDSDGKVLWQSPPETIPTNNVITPQNAYLMTSVLKDVVNHAASEFGIKISRTDLAGKTGTTNQQQDAWFAGYNGSLVTTVWFGFNIPQPLHEYGAQASFPVWLNFMQQALQNSPTNTMEEPEDIVTEKIDPKTGLLAYPGQKNAIFELFYKSKVPVDVAPASESLDISANENTNEIDNTSIQNQDNSENEAPSNDYGVGLF